MNVKFKEINKVEVAKSIAAQDKRDLFYLNDKGTLKVIKSPEDMTYAIANDYSFFKFALISDEDLLVVAFEEITTKRAAQELIGETRLVLAQLEDYGFARFAAIQDSVKFAKVLEKSIEKNVSFLLL